MQASQLALDEVIDVREEGGCIVNEPVRPKGYSLDKLIEGTTDENRHDVVDFGMPQGKEIL